MADDEIGRVIGVHGFHIRVELDSTHKSPVRAGLDGVETQIKINAFVTFEIGAGEAVLGIVTDLDAREVFEPGDQSLTLELVRPRRVASVQLLGTVSNRRGTDIFRFDPGVNVLPTLDTPAIPARREVLEAVLTDAPKRNKPPEDESRCATEFDGPLLIGTATAAADRRVFASFNDLFSRPLAVVGNTGSGKSCSIAHLLQQAVVDTEKNKTAGFRPRFFVLDINGEYSKAFATPEPEGGKATSRIYANGKEFSVPVWLFNAHEVCVWLNAAEQTQQPALVNLWALAKGEAALRSSGFRDITNASNLLMTMISTHAETGRRKKGWGCKECWTAMKGYAGWIWTEATTSTHAAEIDRILLPVAATNWTHDSSFGADDRVFSESLLAIGQAIEARRAENPVTIEQTADKPIYFPVSKLDNPTALETAAEVSPGDRSIRQFLQGLQLRVQNRLTDRRWRSFYNFDDPDINIKTAADWFSRLGIGREQNNPITVIDLSMISHEVLPYACGVIGRMLLELREHVAAEERFREPWVVVLEEAHNYIKPPRMDEPRGLKVSRETFERIAKEGRKFGLSLVVASQRPSEISQTVLSQCANFLAHRLQNPDDIDHFKQIVPSQTRRLFDQITILRSGEAIVLGSAFFVPSRVQVQLPDPSPSSRSSTPYRSWGSLDERFDVQAAIKNWVRNGDSDATPAVHPCPPLL